jgi:hypothetical protein
MRDNASMTRRAWIEADLELTFGHGLFADFSALWLLIHQSRFGKVGSPPSDCALERWREKGREQGVAARERLRDGVEEALKVLGEGFLQHRDNVALVRALETGGLDANTYFQELLRTVYRFIFLFTAEDRGLLRPKGQTEISDAKLYAEGYSLHCAKASRMLPTTRSVATKGKRPGTSRRATGPREAARAYWTMPAAAAVCPRRRPSPSPRGHFMPCPRTVSKR